MPDNKRLVFDPGNQWTNNDVGSYFVLPSAWRRFLFEVLSARDVAVYLYICSITDQNAIAYPTIGQIVDDLGVRSRTTVNTSVDRIVNLRFLLRRKQTAGYLRGRFVYQRPSPHDTLRRLLSEEIDSQYQIDGELYPVKRVRSDNAAFTDGAVKNHLRKLLGEDVYLEYEDASQQKKRKFLFTALEIILRDVIRKPPKPRVRRSTLPAELQAVLEDNEETLPGQI